MKTLHIIFIFIANDFNRIKRKWISLPLLFISPFLFVGLFIWVMMNFIQLNDDTLNVGVVNLDDSKETDILVSALLEASELGAELNMVEYGETEAQKAIEDNHVVSYIKFPDQFYEDMMAGQSSELEVVGNPERQLESYMVRELIDTVVGYIRTSQANILTINYFAEEFGMDMNDRHELLFQSFADYFIQVLSSSTMMDDYEVAQNSSHGEVYYIVNGMFIIITLWILMINIMLTRDVNTRIEERMKLLGVTYLTRSIARIFVISTCIILLSALFLYIVTRFESLYVTEENYLRVLLLLSLYIIATALVLIIVDFITTSIKAKILMQISIVLLIIFFSGAVIPKAYFPLYFMNTFDYIYSFESLHWIENILLNGRYTMQLKTLLSTIFVLIIFLAGSSAWKERMRL